MLPSAQGIAAAVAARLAGAIADGTYPVGARLPSVRRLARDWSVSVTSVVAACARLEDRGLIHRAPRSGMFVRARPVAPAEPSVPRPSPGPTGVSLGELAEEVMRLGRGGGPAAALGTALVDPGLLPAGELAARLARAVRRPAADWIGYADPAGLSELRALIAARAQAYDCAIAPAEVTITAGAMEAITLALRALCREGDVVAVETPVYFGILQLVESLGLRVVEIPSHPRTGMQLESLREAVDEHPVRAVIAVTNFSNPLGGLMPAEAKRELAELLAARGIPLIEDDVYGDLAHDGSRPGVAKTWDRDGLVLLCSSFSKCLSPGLRLGWVAGGRFTARIRQLKLSSAIACPTLTQTVVADHIAGGGYERHLRRLRAVLGERCRALAGRLADVLPAGTRVSRPAGGFVVWAELPPDVDVLRLYRLAAADGIVVTPGMLFSAKRRYRHALRLNASAYVPAVDAAVAQLGRLAAHLRR